MSVLLSLWGPERVFGRMCSYFKKRGHFLFGQRRHVEECEQCLVLRAAGCPQTVCDTSAAWINVVVLQVGVAGSSYVTHMLLSSAVRENKTVSWSWVRAELTGDDSLYLHNTSFKAHFLFSWFHLEDFLNQKVEESDKSLWTARCTATRKDQNPQSVYWCEE